MGKKLGFCVNWKVAGALGVAAVGTWILAPRLVASVLPLLLVAICPLSMLLMMAGMRGGQSEANNEYPRQTAPPPSQLTLARLHEEAAALRERHRSLSDEIARLDGAGDKESAKEEATRGSNR